MGYWRCCGGRRLHTGRRVKDRVAPHAGIMRVRRPLRRELRPERPLRGMSLLLAQGRVAGD